MLILSASRPVLGMSTMRSMQKHTVAGMSRMSRMSPTTKTTTGLQCTQRPGPQAVRTPAEVTLRANSTTANSNPAAAGDVRLDWNTFFRLRAARRRYSVVSSVVTSAGTTVLGVQYLSTQDIESMGAQVMGLDPFVVLGMATMACGAAGWLLGPFVGNAAWSVVNRRFTSSFATVFSLLHPEDIDVFTCAEEKQKEKEFFDRIRRFRVDPSANSIANPVPDYYGEKIGSVQGYRQWLKDQRAYNRKKRSFIL